MTRRRRITSRLVGLALVACVWGAAGSGWTIQPDEVLANPQLEARARTIGKQLRCLVCQNESIDDSDADLARDLRQLVRQRVQAGDTDAQVMAFIVARYGNYVLLKPPLLPETYLLWFGPLVMLLFAGGLAVIFFRDSTGLGHVPPLSADQDRRLAALIGDDELESKDR